MAIRGRFSVDRPLKVQITNKTSWSEIEIPEYNLKKVSVSLSIFDSAIGIYVDAEGMCYTNSVSNLDESTIAEASCY